MMSDAQQRPEPARNLGADDDQLSATASSSRPVWSTWREIPKVCLYPPHLVRTISIALIVGSVLFVINQLDVVLRGDATAVVWLKSALTYVVPFVVSNLGVLVATRADTQLGPTSLPADAFHEVNVPDLARPWLIHSSFPPTKS